MQLTVEQVNSVLQARFGGFISSGKHNPFARDGECCVFELASVLHKQEWTDKPSLVRCFDIRTLNDIIVSNTVRTPWMIDLLVAYDGSLDWPWRRKDEVLRKIVIFTVNRLLSEFPGVPATIRNRCRKAAAIYEAKYAFVAIPNHDKGHNFQRTIGLIGRAYDKISSSHTNDCHNDAAGFASMTAAYAIETMVDASYDIAGLAEGDPELSSKIITDTRNKAFATACQIWLDAARE